MQRKYIAQYRDFIDMVEPIPIRSLRPFRYSLRDYVGDIEELMESVRSLGLLQPIVVRPASGSFEVIAGHRRLEACRRLRWKQVPSIVKDFTDKEAYEACVSENVQRRTLDTIEEAKAFKAYVEDHKWGSISELARRIGKSEPYVSHRILLLKLPKDVLEKINSHSITPSIGRELVWIESPELQNYLANAIEENGLSVREAHKLAELAKSGMDKNNALKLARGEHLENGAADNEDKDNRPDFMGLSPGERAALASNPENTKLKSLARTVLILRMTLIRLDQIIEGSKSDDIRDFLVERRFAIHSIIDECVRARKELLIGS